MSRQFFAQLDENNIVTTVHCVTQQFLEANPERYTGTWVETFFDTDRQTLMLVSVLNILKMNKILEPCNRILRGLGRTNFGTHQHLCRQMVECIVGMKLI
jgi:hypothetical protein